MATTRKKASAEKITLVPLTDLYERADHPIRMRDDDSMQETIESVKNYGVLTPGTVRPRAEGGYEIIAGRRRKLACEAAGLDAMPVIIKNLDDEQAIIEMVDSGIQREEVLPSEKAAAYKMKLEAIKRQGARTDLTSRQVMRGYLTICTPRIFPPKSSPRSIPKQSAANTLAHSTPMATCGILTISTS